MSSPEAPIIRRTRRRLIAWSAGSTLVVLVVLGVAIWVAATRSLAAAGEEQLRARLDELRLPAFSVAVPVTAPGIAVTSDPSQPGLVIGGETSGTIAFVVGAGVGQGSVGLPAGVTIDGGGGPGASGGSMVDASGPVSTGPGAGDPVTGDPVTGDPRAGGTPVVELRDVFAPDATTIAALAGGQTVIRETTLGDAPVRVMATRLEMAGGTATAIVIGDRSAEQDTLRTLLVVLLGGGLAVLVASVLVGYVYAGRALVPIRDSLTRQREFAADASHELRTPLTITRAAVAEARRGRADPEAVDRALDDIDAGTARMERLVDDLLLLARTDAETVELDHADTDLALAAAETTERLESVAAAAGVRLVLAVEPAPVRGDEARLRQLVAILVDNAIRHTPAGGRVTVTVAGRPDPVLTIEDEGPGIDPSDLERVFERFWRAPGAPEGGTGLGLAIARWIAERHGGTIAAANRDGGGARFTVRLPGA